MKFFLVGICLYFVSFQAVLSNQPLLFRLNLIGNDTIVFNKLVFGFHPDATNGLDTAIGELDLPPLIPPSGFKLYGVFIFFDSTQQSNIWSYLDLRQFPSKSADTIKFLLYAIRESGIRLRISWPNIGDEIRYAWLVDEYLGTLVQVDMKKNRFVNIQNEFLDKFYIKLILADVNSVDYDDSSDIIVKYEWPENSIYIKKNSKEIVTYRIYDMYGRIVSESSLEEEKLIDSRMLSKGLYFVELYYIFGKKEIRKVIVY